MRILAITDGYPPGATGAWRATHVYLRHAVRAGHQVSAVRPIPSRPGRAGTFDGVDMLGGAISAGSRIVADFDVIVSPSSGDGVAARLADANAIPHVRFAHGAGSLDGTHADLIVANAYATAERITADCPVIVCHPITDPDLHRVDQTGERITLVNLSEDKGVKTAWRCSERLPAHSFLGVRGGWGYQHLPRTPNFDVWPIQKDMRKVWAETRILLMPSAYETWGMVGVEALCSGIPVIAHPTPGLRESLGDAGIFADRADTDAWVAALERLDDPDEYAAASARASARSAELDPAESLDRFAAAVEALV